MTYYVVTNAIRLEFNELYQTVKHFTNQIFFIYAQHKFYRRQRNKNTIGFIKTPFHTTFIQWDFPSLKIIMTVVFHLQLFPQ